jgi:hypothetical protein
MAKEDVSGPIPEKRANPSPASEIELEWLTKHSAGVLLEQRSEGKLSYLGTLPFNGQQVSLGEAPPLFHHQIKVGKTAILLGELDNRHRLVRHLHAIRDKDTALRIDAEISVTSPRVAGSGGFVFIANDDSISRFGIIVPVAEVPAGDDPESDQWRTSVRLNNQGRFEKELSRDEISAIPVQEVLPAWKVLMDAGSAPYTARVIWYRVEPSGEFSREG